jgi:hypothetical protein
VLPLQPTCLVSSDIISGKLNYSCETLSLIYLQGVTILSATTYGFKVRKIWLSSYEQKMKLQLIKIISTSVTPYINLQAKISCAVFHFMPSTKMLNTHNHSLEQNNTFTTQL